MYTTRNQIEKIIQHSILKLDEFLEGLKKHEVNGKIVYLYRDVQKRYNKMSSDYYEKGVK